MNHNCIPRHIAIIMDGNGRWAKMHNLHRVEGHVRGAEMIERVVEACRDRGVEYLTLYAFSEENWSRPSKEILSLMDLLRHFLRSKRAKLIEKKTRFRAIGDMSKLPEDVRDEIVDMEEATSGGDVMTLIVALSYGSRQEIISAVNNLIKDGAHEIDQETLSDAMYTKGIPDPDLLIRTSGEYRISNFLLWQLAYSELYFTDKLWPEFTEEELDKAIASYGSRERRFGMISEQLGEK